MLDYLPAIAIAMSVIGTLMIFLFGMPFRVKPVTVPQLLWTGKTIEPPREAVISSRAFDFLSWAGLTLALTGGAIQFGIALP
ncbi:hypothetical protein [Pseudogemmobacter sonorensis]|uniref:hypothetical protein n=1 Tax=Pseudogemmobacter sonorensis TaxID=2989681 RepID=UPI003685C7B9